MDNMTSERVDAEGISNIAKAAKEFLPQRSFQPETEQVISMRSKEDLEVWEKLDDTIMGGKSGSFLQVGFKEMSRIFKNCHCQGTRMAERCLDRCPAPSVLSLSVANKCPCILALLSYYAVTVVSTVQPLS